MSDLLRERELARQRRQLNRTETMETDIDDSGGLDLLNVGTSTSAVTGEVRASANIVAAKVGGGLDSMTPAAPLHAQQQTQDTVAVRIETVAANDNVIEDVIQSRAATTDATVTTLWSYTIPASTTVMLDVHVVARRTGGVSGTAHDTGAYVIRGAFKNVGGTTATIVGAINADFTAEDQAGWNATLDVNAQNIRLRITGAAGNNITWHATIRFYQVST